MRKKRNVARLDLGDLGADAPRVEALEVWIDGPVLRCDNEPRRDGRPRGMSDSGTHAKHRLVHRFLMDALARCGAGDRLMAFNAYRFVERWTIPGGSPSEVYEVLSNPRLFPAWWKGVYLNVEPWHGEWETPRVGARIRAVARGFPPYRLYFVLESTVLEPGRTVAVRVRGDLDRT